MNGRSRLRRHPRLLSHAAFGLVVLAGILAVSAWTQAPTASAWSWNQASMKLALRAGQDRNCHVRRLTLTPGYYDRQSFINRRDWDDGAKWGSRERYEVLIRRRGDYDWTVCGELWEWARPQRSGRYRFRYSVKVEHFVTPAPGGGGAAVGFRDLTPDGPNYRANRPTTFALFYTNSGPGMFLVGTRIMRTRLLARRPR